MKRNLHVALMALLAIILSVSDNRAQAPGGVTPAAWYKAGTDVFLDAGSTSASNNSTVQQWNDQIASRPLIQSSSGSRPIFSNATTLANFNPTLTFDGSNDWMHYIASGNNIIDRANGTIYVAGYKNTNKRSGFAGFHSTMDFPGLHAFQSDNKLLFFTSGGPGYQGKSTEAIEAQAFFTAGAAWQNGATYAAATVSLNGVRQSYSGNEIYNVNTASGYNDFRIGTDSNYGAFHGQLNEIIIFEEELSAAQMNQIDSYLAIKYGNTFAKGQVDYVNSTGNPVWTAAVNDGYHHNIAGIARDDNSALYQKQSWSINNGNQVLIGVGTLANTNDGNSGILDNGQYLVWGDNGLDKVPTIPTTAFSGLSHHFAAVWKVQNTGNVGTVRVAWPKSFNHLTLIQSVDATIDGSDAVTIMDNEVTINDVVYNYADITLTNGSYFTFAAKLAGPGGVTAGLMMWHRADDGTTASGLKNIWRDLSGMGRHVTQNNNAAYQPTLITNASHSADSKVYSFNFNPFYYFDGTNDFFYREGDLYFPDINSPGSTYGVMFNSNRGGWHTPYGWADDDPNFFRWDERYEVWRDNSRPLMTNDIDARRLPANIGGMSWRGNGINGIYMNLDGKTYSTTSYNIGTLNNNRTPPNFAIGSEGHNLTGNGNEHHQGGISEVFAYSVDHQNSAGDEKQRINSYLAIKYGITLKNDAGTDAPNYLSSNSTVVWDATANNGYNNNIAGLAKDENSALDQKQSHSNKSGQQVLIGTTGLSNTNAANTTSLTEGQFLIWGDNGEAKSLSNSFNFASVPTLNLRFGAIWKVQNTNNVGTVRVAWPSGIPSIHLIQSTDEVIDDTDLRTDMTGNITTINGVSYNYADVTLQDNEYFTFAGFVVGPGNVASAAWYRADAFGQLFSDAGTTVATDGQALHQWNEYKGTGYDLVQASIGDKPIFSNSSTLANFNPTVTFPGSHFMRYTAPTGVDVIDRTDGSIYAAGYLSQMQNTGFAGFHNSMDYPGLHTYNVGGGDYKLLFFTGGPGYQGLSSNSFSQKSYFIIGSGWNNGGGSTSAYAEATVSLNGIHTTYTGTNQIQNTIINTTTRDFQIGQDGNHGALNGQLNEVVVFENKLSDDEMDRVETYMAIKFGTTYAEGTKNYKNSVSETVWSSTLNNGFHSNIAGIARDDLGSLSQKQSWSTNLGKQVLISTTSLANTNAGNAGVLSDKQYLIWGDNNLAKAPIVSISGNSDVNYRFAAIWKVQNTNAVGLVRVAWPKGLTNLKLIQSPDDIIDATDDFTDMAGTQTINGVEYAYTDVTLANGQYFTFAAYVQAPGGVTNGLSHWYRADKLTESTGEGNDITSWTDFTSGVISAQINPIVPLPKLKEGEATYFNFNPGVNFTATDQMLGNISEQTLSSLDFDIFTLTKEGMSGTRFFNIGMNNTTFGGTNWDHPGLYTNGTIARRNNTGGSVGVINPGGINFGTTAPNIMYHSFSDLAMSKGLNGAPMGSEYTHTARGTVTGGHIFGANNNSGSNPPNGDDGGFTGHIGELIIYGNGTITSAERNKVDSYLAIKYGVTLNSSNNYTTSQNVVVWSAADNTGFYNNVAGIGHDFVSALHQKQSRSQHTNSNNQVIIGLVDIAETNKANVNILGDGQFLMWGDNGITQAMTNSSATYSPFEYAGSTENGRRMNRVWKVQNTGVNQEVLIRFPVASVGTTTFATADACAAYVLLLADDAGFTTNVITKSLTLSENEVDYDVLHTFGNGTKYFTYAKIKPWNQGIVYLPSAIETTNVYADPCDIGDWKYFRNSTDNTQKLFGATGFENTDLDNFEVTITPEGTSYDDGTRLTNLMPRITTIENGNATYAPGGKIRIYYDQAELNATAVPGEQVAGWYKYDGNADEVVIDIFSDGLFDHGKAVAISPNASGTEDGVQYVEFHNVTSFSSFIYISTTETSPLPVTLTYFKATKEGQVTILDWATSSENNNAGFEIQRSNNARDWTALGVIQSNGVNNNSNSALNYSFTDIAPLNGTNYYRLKQTDLDGRFEYSRYVTVQFGNSGSELILYPNPVIDGNLTLKIAERTPQHVRIYSVSGVEVFSVKQPGNDLNIKNLPAGVYILKVRLDNGEVINKSFIIK